MDYDYDVIVVGGGAGGATFAYACARAGKSVLLLERGSRYLTTTSSHDEKAMLIEKRPYDDREVDVNGKARRLYMGGVLGGGTSLYGGALVRPSDQDFQPGKYYGKRIPRAIWDWPISYADLEPYYTEVEQLYGVAGRGEEDFAPLQKPAAGYPGDPLPLHPLNHRLMAANRMHGLHPFRLPLAIDSSRCLRCGVCAGYICPTGARSSSAQLLERAIADGLRITIQTQVEVERLVKEPGTGATLIAVLDRISGRRVHYRARRYALGGRRDRIVALAASVGRGQPDDRPELHDAPVLGRRWHLSSCQQDGVELYQTGGLRRLLFRHQKIPAQDGADPVAASTWSADDGQDVSVRARSRAPVFTPADSAPGGPDRRSAQSRQPRDAGREWQREADAPFRQI